MNPQNVNILAIAPYRFLPAVNGGHKAIEQLYTNLGLLTQTIVVSVKNNDASFAKNYKLVKLFGNSALHYINVLYFFKLKQLIREHHITHVITDHVYMGWLGILLKKYTSVTFIVRSHNIESMRFKTIGKWWWKAMWHYEKWICKRADFNFYITEEDRSWAINQYHVEEGKCFVITFGTERQKPPSPEAKKETKALVYLQHSIPSSHCLLLFNGDLGYAPNESAVEIIIREINPLLLKLHFLYTIVICGRNLDDKYRKQIENSDEKIKYAGYVDDISSYFLAADVFINPVVSGGGVKTKLVEALSYECNAVSTVSGANGIPVDITNGKLKIVRDNDWHSFAKAVSENNPTIQISTGFYGHFYWGNIARRAIDALEKR